MKKYMISILLAMLIISFAFGEGDNDSKNRFPDNLKKHLNSKVEYPETAWENKIEGYVAVLFEVNNSGQLVIKETSANDALLRQHVQHKLENIQLCPFDLSVGNSYSITFYFNLL